MFWRLNHFSTKLLLAALDFPIFSHTDTHTWGHLSMNIVQRFTATIIKCTSSGWMAWRGRYSRLLFYLAWLGLVFVGDQPFMILRRVLKSSNQNFVSKMRKRRRFIDECAIKLPGRTEGSRIAAINLTLNACKWRNFSENTLRRFS